MLSHQRKQTQLRVFGPNGLWCKPTTVGVKAPLVSPPGFPAWEPESKFSSRSIVLPPCLFRVRELSADLLLQQRSSTTGSNVSPRRWSSRCFSTVKAAVQPPSLSATCRLKIKTNQFQPPTSCFSSGGAGSVDCCTTLTVKVPRALHNKVCCSFIHFIQKKKVRWMFGSKQHDCT